jgi:hypothetical protein
MLQRFSFLAVALALCLVNSAPAQAQSQNTTTYTANHEFYVEQPWQRYTYQNGTFAPFGGSGTLMAKLALRFNYYQYSGGTWVDYLHWFYTAAYPNTDAGWVQFVAGTNSGTPTYEVYVFLEVLNPDGSVHSTEQVWHGNITVGPGGIGSATFRNPNLEFGRMAPGKGQFRIRIAVNEYSPGGWVYAYASRYSPWYDPNPANN